MLKKINKLSMEVCMVCMLNLMELDNTFVDIELDIDNL